MIGVWGKLFYWFSWTIIKVLTTVLFRLRIDGARHVPRRGSLLVACNHISHLDPPLVGVACPRMVFHMAKKELFSVKLLEWFMNQIGTIMVHRGQGKQALVDAEARLNQGACVVIFPEGTRSMTGQLGKGHSGAIVLAVRTGCQIQPAAIIGSEKAMAKGTKRIRFVRITVRFGEPYSLPRVEGGTIPRDLLEIECVKLMAKIEALLPEQMRPTADQKLQWYGRYAIL